MTSHGLNTPEDYFAVYELLRDELSKRVIGHAEAIQILSLVGTRHLAGAQGQRLVLAGPSGVGKSTLSRSLAEVMAMPWKLIDVTMLAEQNWQGAQLTDYLQALWDENAPAEAARAVLVLDELDKICVGETEGSSRSYRVGKQQTLLPLLGTGSAIPLASGHSVKPDSMLIIMAGVWRGLPPGPVGADQLVALGLLHEIVERLGPVIRLEPLRMPQLVQIFRKGLEQTVDTYRRFGYVLEVQESTLCYVASAVLQSGAGPRSAVTWLRRGGDLLLIRLLEEGAPPATLVRLSPDDLEVPVFYPRSQG